MMLLDRHFNSSSSRNIALENGIGSTPLWFQVTGLYGMTLLRERVNFQVSRKRSFARAPNPPSTFAKFPIKVATMCPHGNRERVLFDTNRSEMSRGRRKVSVKSVGSRIAQDQGPGGFPGWGFTFRYWRL